MKKQFIILGIIIISISVLYSKGKIDYKRILDFEDIKYWTHLKADKKLRKSGKQSGRWDKPLKNNRVDCKTVPSDWSKYNAVKLWIHSNKAKNFKFALVLQSENESTSGWDFYMRHFMVNWTGWKEFIIPFDKFVSRRKPLGWKHIDRIRFASTGYAISGSQPDDVVLNFDKIELIKITDEFKQSRLKGVMGFEIVSAWSGMEKSSEYVKQGKYSGKWANTEKITRVDCSDLPSNWSKYNALQVWIYSKVANNAGFEIVVISDNPSTKRDDYLHYSITVDWKGWKKIIIPFDKFNEKYNPIGWNKIDKIRLAALGYGHTPKKDTELYFDDLRLVNISMVPIVELQKHYYKNNKYINYFKIPVKNVSRKKLNYQVKIIKGSKKFNPIIRYNGNNIKPGKKDIVELFFELKGKGRKTVKNKIPYENIKIAFVSDGSKETINLKLYYPFNIKYKHPYVVLSKKEISEMRKKYKKYKWVREAADAMLHTAGKYSRGDVPEETGGDFHERIGSYEITKKHIDFSRAARYYGILYVLTGEKKYARSAKRILMRYTEVYPKLKRADKYGKVGDAADLSGGKLCVQLLSDAKWDIFMAQAYDLTYNFYSEEEREKIENMLRDQAEMIMKHKRGAHNFQAVYNSALAVIGYTLQDPAYIDYALNEPSNGFLSLQIKKSFTKDMMYYERSPHYHHFIISYLSYLFEAVYHSHFNIYKWKGIKSIYDVLLKISDKEYEVPYVNDGGYFNFTEQKRGWPYIIAYKRYNDKKYLWIINKLSKTAPEALMYLPGKIYADKSKSVSSSYYSKNYDSFYLPDTEWAFIRAKNNSELGDFYFTLKYDQYYSSHTHLDRMGLIVKSFNKFVLPDAGSVKYGNPAQVPWFRSTISHNTLLVDMQPQSLTASTSLDYFYTADSFQAVSANVVGLYGDSVKMRRSLFLLDNSYIIDYVSVNDSQNIKHKYDLVYHFDGKPDYKSFKPKKSKNIYRDSSPNYAFIDDFSVYALSKKNKDIVADYKIDSNKFVRFWNKGLKGLKIIAGKGIIANKKDGIRESKTALLLLRYDSSSSAQYISILQPYTYKITEQKIRRFKTLLNNNDAKLLKILRKNGAIEYFLLSDFGVDSAELSTDGVIAYVKMKDNNLYNITLINGKKIKIGNNILKLNRKGSVSVSCQNKSYIFENFGKNSVKLLLTGNLVDGRKKLTAKLRPGKKIILR